MNKNKAWTLLGILGFLAILLRAYMANRAQVYFDGCGYIMHAWSIAQGRLTTPYWMAQMDHYYPPLYPTLIYLFHFLIPSWPDAAKTVSVFFSVLLFIPVYALARKMFYEEVALLAAALMVAYPMLVETGSNAYSEPVYLFFICLSMLWGFQMVVEKKSLRALLCGLALGIAYLARPQAVAGLPSLGLALFWFWAVKRQLRLSHFVKFLALILIGFYLFALPYDLYNYRKDGIWGLRIRIEFFKKGYQYDEDLKWYIRERTLNRDATALLTYERARDNSPLAFIRTHPKVYLGWVMKDFKLVAQNEFIRHISITPRNFISVLPSPNKMVDFSHKWLISRTGSFEFGPARAPNLVHTRFELADGFCLSSALSRVEHIFSKEAGCIPFRAFLR